MSSRHFPVVVTPSVDGGFVVECPLIRGCATQGETREEALENLREVIVLFLQDPDVRAELARVEDLEIRMAV
jgi:predicted RNase H-like HicB family nuclease